MKKSTTYIYADFLSRRVLITTTTIRIFLIFVYNSLLTLSKSVLMRVLLLLFIILLYPLNSYGESATSSSLKFDNKEWNFGTIKETDGVVSHTYVFMNISDKPINIDDVLASCGCTTTSYTTAPIESGEVGEITVTFNPINTSGEVIREVYVLTNERKNSDILVVNATVEPAPLSLRQKYPIALKNNFRIERTNSVFGYIAQGRSESKGIMLANLGDKTVKLRAETVGNSSFLRVECPYIIEPEGEENLVFSYKIPIGKDNYGILRDSVWIWIDNERAERPILISAIMTDDFSNMDHNRPAIRVTPSYFDVGLKGRNKTIKNKILISNDGNIDLIIRAIDIDSETSIELSKDDIIKPGESINVNLTTKTPSGSGQSIIKSVTLITNDPVRPQKEIRISIATK